ncbi:MAG: LEA type 2 family protein [Dehalococcoidia bacterium]
MKKLYLPIAIVILAIMLASAACAPSELKPATVTLNLISNEWQGSETLVADSVFSIENPNNVPVTLDQFNYTISLNGQALTQRTVGPEIVIPANTTVQLMYANVLPFTGFGGVAFEGYYMAKSMPYVPSQIAGAAPWKLLGGREPGLWADPNIQVLNLIRSGPTADNITKGVVDNNTATAMYLKIRGLVDAVQGPMDKAWAAYPAGPCKYDVSGKATVSNPNFNKSVDTTFTLSFTKP